MVSEAICHPSNRRSGIRPRTPKYRGVAPDAIENLSERIRAVVRERQVLRGGGADAEQLERNRLEIVELQRRLSEALVARFRPAAA